MSKVKNNITFCFVMAGIGIMIFTFALYEKESEETKYYDLIVKPKVLEIEKQLNVEAVKYRPEGRHMNFHLQEFGRRLGEANQIQRSSLFWKVIVSVSFIWTVISVCVANYISENRG